MSIYDPQRRRDRPGARVAMSLLRLAQAIKKLSQEDGAAAGLTPVQAQTLLFIRYTKPFLTTMGNLARALGATHVTAVGVVNVLIAHNLVTKVPNPLDRRSSLLRLTPAGEAACQRLEHWGLTLEASVGQLPPDELAALERGLGAIIWSLRAVGQLHVGEPCRGCYYFTPDARPGAAEPHRCGLIDGYLSEADARLDCPDHTPAALAERQR
ncbi:MAG TPA: MarR family winged helix-turn-helix transcriptional regulator [Chloroflexota bacterium]|nr:MarR family winged helix-turn-helix transcriptional regulator [Chloroflexota bacterium]